MSVKQIFCVIMSLLGIAGIVGASSLRLFRGTSFGPGMMPMVYSVLLLLLSVVFFFSKKDEDRTKIDFKSLLSNPSIEGVIFYGMNLAMLLVLYLLGTVTAMVLFCVCTLLLLKRMKWGKAILFGTVWVGVLYTLFELVLGVPFETGILVDSFVKAFIY